MSKFEKYFLGISCTLIFITILNIVFYSLTWKTMNKISSNGFANFLAFYSSFFVFFRGLPVVINDNSAEFIFSIILIAINLAFILAYIVFAVLIAHEATKDSPYRKSLIGSLMSLVLLFLIYGLSASNIEFWISNNDSVKGDIVKNILLSYATKIGTIAIILWPMWYWRKYVNWPKINFKKSKKQ